MDIQEEIRFLGNMEPVQKAVAFINDDEYDKAIGMLMHAICEIATLNGSPSEVITDIESRSDQHSESLKSLVTNLETVGFSEHSSFAYFALFDFIHDIYDFEDDSPNALLWTMRKLDLLESHPELEGINIDHLPQRLIHSALGELDSLYYELQALPATEAESYLRAKGDAVKPIHVRLVRDKLQSEGIDTQRFECDHLTFFQVLFGCQPESPKGIYILRTLLEHFCNDKDLEHSLIIARYLFDILRSQEMYTYMLGCMSLLMANFTLDPSDVEILLLSKYTIDAALTLLEQGIEPDMRIYRVIFNAALRLLPAHWLDTEFYNACIKRLVAQKPTTRDDDNGKLRTELYEALEKLYIEALSYSGDDSYQLTSVLTDSVKKLFGDTHLKDIKKEEQPGSAALKTLDELQKELLLQETLNQLMPDDSRNLPEMALLRAKYLTAFAEYTTQVDLASPVNSSVYIDYLLRPARYKVFTEEDVEQNLRTVLTSFDAINISSHLHKYELDLIREAAESLCVYFLTKQAELSVKYAVLYNKCSRYIYKRVLVDEGLESSIRQVQTDTDSYNVVLSIALLSLMNVTNSLSSKSTLVNDMFTEITIRQNLLVTIEKWAKRTDCATLADIQKLIDEEIGFDDICSCIPADSVLVQFVYSRQRWKEVFEKHPTATNEVTQSLLTRPFWKVGLTDTQLNADNDVLGYCLTLDDGRTVKTHLIGEADEVKKNIDRLRLKNPHSISFFRTKIGEVLNDYQSKDRLFIASDGDFNRVSFAALPYNDGFVIDSFAVRNIANVYELIRSSTWKPPEKALIVTVSDFGGESPHQTLESTRIEGQRVEMMIGRDSILVDRLTDDKATRENVLSAISDSNYDIIHISTHGDKDPTDGDIQIALYNANRNPESFLSTNDFEDAVRNSPTLVFLSLCHGGAITANLQESISDFIKSAIISGVQSIIAPLVAIPDEATLQFCELFYTKYLQDGNSRSIDTTFRDALVEFKNQDSKGYWKDWVVYSNEKS